MTTQTPERLIYQGTEHDMCTEPLGDYFAMGGRNPGFELASTALHRGYKGSWAIEGGRLYLMKLAAKLADRTEANLESVFPGFPQRVFAHWYTGTLRLPQGELLHRVRGGYLSIRERDLMLEMARGVLQRTWVRHNEAEQ